MSLSKDLQQINHEIPLDKAVEMTRRFRNDNSKILQQDYSKSLPQSEIFDKSAFEKLVGLPGCVGIRAYFGVDDKNDVRLIFVGVNDKNEDILPGGGGGSIVEFGQRCPPICPVSSPLNGDL